MRHVAALVVLAGALACVPVAAEQFVRAGGFEIHYNAFHSGVVPAEVASAHGIARTRSRGLVNVTVLAPRDGGVGQATEARVAGSVVNLAGQRQALAFRAIREADALYYLAEFAIAGEDLYRFELEVQPARAARAESIRLQQPLVGR